MERELRRSILPTWRGELEGGPLQYLRGYYRFARPIKKIPGILFQGSFRSTYRRVIVLQAYQMARVILNEAPEYVPLMVR